VCGRHITYSAVIHFQCYCFVFVLGTFTLYVRLARAGGNSLAEWCIAFYYVIIHGIKAAMVGRLLTLTRFLLYTRYAKRRYEQAATYLAALLRIVWLQLVLFVVVAATGPTLERLFAATTLSISMPQSFVLSVVAMRDTGGTGALPAAKMTTMNYTCIELSAFVLIVTYGILALLAYFMAIGLGEGQLEATQGSIFQSRWLYFQVCIVYLAGAACVTHVVQRRVTEEAEKAKQRHLSIDDQAESATESDHAHLLPTRFRCTTKVLVVVGLALAVMHRHAVANSCYVPITDHFKGGGLGCW